MPRTLTALALVFGSLFVFAGVARADEPRPPGYVVPPFTCGPTQAPSQVPCDQIPTVPTTAPSFRWCLGYPQQFPYDQPCPKAPVELCALYPEEFACTDPSRPPAVERVVGGTVPTTVAPEAAVEAPVDVQVSSTVVVHQTQHRAIQRRSQPTTLPTTGSSSTTVVLAGVAALLVGGALLIVGRRTTQEA